MLLLGTSAIPSLSKSRQSGWWKWNVYANNTIHSFLCHIALWSALKLVLLIWVMVGSFARQLYWPRRRSLHYIWPRMQWMSDFHHFNTLINLLIEKQWCGWLISFDVNDIVQELYNYCNRSSPCVIDKSTLGLIVFILYTNAWNLRGYCYFLVTPLGKDSAMDDPSIITQLPREWVIIKLITRETAVCADLN